ncbi:MAG: hypothetical protein M1813_003577 [Trichoglossum hirsutum]|nr:MAG: hypothetical protein M1813_003577 [Trichoglossum hirsutum]
MSKHDLDTDYTIILTTTTVESPTTMIPESPTTMIADSPATMIANSPTTMIAESPTTNIGEIPILRVSTEREGDSAFRDCETEERRYIARPNEVPLSAVLEGSKTEGRGGIAKVPLSEPLWVCRLSSKLDKLDKLGFTLLHILNCLEALDKKVDSLEITGNGVRDAIKGVQDDILSLQRAKDETLMYIDERLEKLRKGSTTRQGDISISVHFPEG